MLYKAMLYSAPLISFFSLQSFQDVPGFTGSLFWDALIFVVCFGGSMVVYKFVLPQTMGE